MVAIPVLQTYQVYDTQSEIRAATPACSEELLNRIPHCIREYLLLYSVSTRFPLHGKPETKKGISHRYY